jgi:PadR family transcriptional regulator, regulatory protein AphA
MSRPIKTYYPILGLLGIKPMSGYEIRSWIEDYLGFFWSEGWGQIYPALRELEGRGYISLLSDAAAEAKGSRPRKVFAITESGKAALSRYLSAPPDDAIFRSELLLKIFFGAAAGDKVIQRHVEAELAKQRAIEACRSSLDGELDASSGTACDKGDVKYWKYALRFGRMYNRFIQEWCESVLADMSKKED